MNMSKNELKVLKDLKLALNGINKAYNEDKNLCYRLPFLSSLVPHNYISETKGFIRENRAARRLIDKGLLVEISKNTFTLTLKGKNLIESNILEL